MKRLYRFFVDTQIDFMVIGDRDEGTGTDNQAPST